MKSRANDSNKIPILSFFTGGGFFDIGFEQAGFDVIWSNEFNPAFADNYEFGMTSWRKAQGRTGDARISERRSISRISSNEIASKAFPEGIPELFGIIGGPPCPDFSSAGKHQGGVGKHGRLTSAFIKKICELRPSFFVMENVPGLFKTKTHRRYLDRIIKRLEKTGYRIDLKILNSLDLGVPQDRERLVIVGISGPLLKTSLDEKSTSTLRGWFPWPINPKYLGAKTRFSWPRKVKKGGRAAPFKNTPIELTVSSILGTNGEIGKLPNGNEYFIPYSAKFKTALEGDTKRKSFKRLHRFRFSPTACYGHNEVHLHPWKDRRLAVREAMRIQGIPDTYCLPPMSSLSSKFKMVSNGVPVPLAREVANSLRQFISANGHLE